MLFRGLILAVSVAFVAFVFVLMDVLAKAGLDARLMWIIGAMVTGVAVVAVASLSLSAKLRNGGHDGLAPLISGFAKSDIGVALIDAYGKTIYANPAFSSKLGIDAGSDMLSALEARLSFLGIGGDELAELRTRAMRGEGGQMFVDLSRSDKFADDTGASEDEGSEETGEDNEDDRTENTKTSANGACLRIAVTAANARAGQMLWTVDGVDQTVLADRDASVLLPSDEPQQSFALSAPQA
ncbi:MAG TPA: PAS domain-containing sensor histidine kinase, partial [Thalassospira sp.]|nr:PAS domain-containing sensor histidine kinase [Thalassospira sp.]